MQIDLLLFVQGIHHTFRTVGGKPPLWEKITGGEVIAQAGETGRLAGVGCDISEKLAVRIYRIKSRRKAHGNGARHRRVRSASSVKLLLQKGTCTVFVDQREVEKFKCGDEIWIGLHHDFVQTLQLSGDLEYGPDDGADPASRPPGALVLAQVGSMRAVKLQTPDSPSIEVIAMALDGPNINKLVDVLQARLPSDRRSEEAVESIRAQAAPAVEGRGTPSATGQNGAPPLLTSPEFEKFQKLLLWVPSPAEERLLPEFVHPRGLFSAEEGLVSFCFGESLERDLEEIMRNEHQATKLFLMHHRFDEPVGSREHWECRYSGQDDTYDWMWTELRGAGEHEIGTIAWKWASRYDHGVSRNWLGYFRHRVVNFFAPLSVTVQDVTILLKHGDVLTVQGQLAEVGERWRQRPFEKPTEVLSAARALLYGKDAIHLNAVETSDSRLGEMSQSATLTDWAASIAGDLKDAAEEAWRGSLELFGGKSMEDGRRIDWRSDAWIAAYLGGLESLAGSRENAIRELHDSWKEHPSNGRDAGVWWLSRNGFNSDGPTCDSLAEWLARLSQALKLPEAAT